MKATNGCASAASSFWSTAASRAATCRSHSPDKTAAWTYRLPSGSERPTHVKSTGYAARRCTAQWDPGGGVPKAWWQEAPGREGELQASAAVMHSDPGRPDLRSFRDIRYHNIWT